MAIYGGSAGGGLALGTVLPALDRGGPRLSFMLPIYPMIDDTNTHPSTHEITDIGIWDRAGNLEAWEWYLGGKEADQYAAPGRVLDVSGLPPAFIDVGSGRPECRASCMTIRGATTRVRLPAPDAALSQRIWEGRPALSRALH